MQRLSAALCGVLALLSCGSAGAAGVRGDYIEARTADIYTGPCFSNGEVFITGSQAILAWKVTEGSWEGVDLGGLSVAAAVRGNTTFSQDRPEAALSVLIVDKDASPSQRAALIALAKNLGGKRLGQVVDIKDSIINVTVEDHPAAKDAPGHAGHTMPHAPRAQFWAPGLAQITTRPLDEGDHFCGNETVAYPPLSKGVDVLPAYTLGNHFKGQGLDTTWDDPNCRSSFVGHFAL